jgi:hypothetical protein
MKLLTAVEKMKRSHEQHEVQRAVIQKHRVSCHPELFESYGGYTETTASAVGGFEAYTLFE